MITCGCGLSFPAHYGEEGCPACNGALSPSQRQARSRAARASTGGKQIAVMLTPAAAAKLAAWVSRGESIASVVNRLLVRSRP